MTHEQLAMVSVVKLEWAAKNSRATSKAPITRQRLGSGRSRRSSAAFNLVEQRCRSSWDGGLLDE
jgi:hypothetical protein